MKKFLCTIQLSLFLCSVIPFSLFPSAENNIGIKQSCIITQQPCIIYTLEIDPAQRNITIEHAAGNCCSREPVSSIIERIHGLAGLNCNNYRRGGAFNGNAVDFLKIKDTIYADPGIRRSVICWNKTTNKPLIGPIKTVITLTIDSEKIVIDRINQPRQDNEAIVYTPAFGASTRTGQNRNSNTGHSIIDR